MPSLKSIFISCYLTLLTAITGYASWQLAQGAAPLAWIGVLLAATPTLLVIGALMLFRNIARTSANFPVLNVLGVCGVVLTGWVWYSQALPALAPLLALVGWLGFLLYVYWYSRFGGRTPGAHLAVGNTLPGFTLADAHGKTLASTRLADKPTILIFYRGNWCPLCMAQIKELAGRYREISALGVRVALISPQPHDNTAELAKKFDVGFEFFSDHQGAAARILGIEHVGGTPLGMQVFGYDTDTVLSTVIITDNSGKVIWTHQTDNYRIRPEPDTYLEILRQHGLVPPAAA